MLSPVVGHITLGIYAALLAVGGVMGFVKAKSKASLISGLLSAAFAVVALVLAALNVSWGFPLGLLLAITLFILFGYRYAAKGRKFMPSGLLAIVSIVVIIVLALLTVMSDDQEPRTGQFRTTGVGVFICDGTPGSTSAPGACCATVAIPPRV
jgi:uncharacterized membrane protein (UPF0136 family)